MSDVRLTGIQQCFRGIVPSIIVTTDRNGIPNVTYVSQVYLIDDQHVALSRQFFNKTSRNLDETGRVAAEVMDPVTFQAYRIRMRFLRSETSGPLFEKMSLRVDAIASATGMAGVFKLIASDICEVISVEKVEGFLSTVPDALAVKELSVDGFRTEMRGLQVVSDRINRAEDLETLLAAVLDALAVYFHFEHTMVLLNDEASGKLVTIACRGYGGGVGAEVAMGEGIIGTAAREQKVLRLTGLHASMHYSRAVRREVERDGRPVTPEIALPGLTDAHSTLVLPLTIGDRLVGVLAAESRDPMAFGEWHEAYLEIVGNQIALGIDRIIERGDDDDDAAVRWSAPPPAPAVVAPPVSTAPARNFVFYRNDDCVFVDDEYLIRNVPGRILWKLLTEWKQRGRTEFTNRELRLDESLGLPEFKDNLESRLILLRHRLQEKSPGVQMVPTGRGKFALQVTSELALAER
jgi:putative methionine-R-sulfoxide reductase with GAF domain